MSWEASSLSNHIDQHNSDYTGASEIISIHIGTLSASAVKFLYYPRNNTASLQNAIRVAYVVVEADVAADGTGTNYWDIIIAQRDTQGRFYNLLDLPGTSRKLTAYIPARLPEYGLDHAPLGGRKIILQPGVPVVLRAIKTGSPSNLTGLSVQLNLSS